MRLFKFIPMIAIAFAISGTQAKDKPTIKITDIPEYDAKGGSDRVGTIKGIASIGDCKGCRVVLFARTNKWWVQPLADSPYTQIVNGKWQSETHLGTNYAAVLVAPAYRAPATAESLPTIGTDVLAIDIKGGKK